MESGGPRILKASYFAAEKHKNQKRKGDNSPYINHPLGVANNIMTIGGVIEEDILIGAILHDTVEDTDTTLDEIEQHFGAKIRGIVDEVSDSKDLSKVERKRGQIAHAGQISREAKHVKLGDKLYNLRDLQRVPPKGWDRERIQGYYVWAHFVIAQMRGTNEGLEKALDEVFKGEITTSEGTFPCIPPGDLNEHLDVYYASMSKLND